MLAIFNLIPVPPLDGSKLVFAILPDQYGRLRMTLEQFGPILFIVVVFFLWQFIAKIVPVLFKLLIGV
jgi:Zn-dependent protease